jgi:hypothetical protein
MYKILSLLSFLIQKYRVFPILLTADDIVVSIYTFFLFLFIGAIYLDSAPLSEEALIRMIPKENDFDVYYGFGSQRFCLAEKVDALDLKSRRR